MVNEARLFTAYGPPAPVRLPTDWCRVRQCISCTGRLVLPVDRVPLLCATVYRYLAVRVLEEAEDGPAMDDLTEMLKGTLEGCVLEIIDSEETYGYAITRRLNELGFADVVEGTVYTILLRLETQRTRPGDETAVRDRARRASSMRSTTRGARNSGSSGRNGVRLITDRQAQGGRKMNFWETDHRQRPHQGMEGVRGSGRGSAGRLPGGVGRDQGAPFALRGLHRPQPDADPRRRSGAARRDRGRWAEHPRGAGRRHRAASVRRWPAAKGPGAIATGGASS